MEGPAITLLKDVCQPKDALHVLQATATIREALETLAKYRITAIPIVTVQANIYLVEIYCCSNNEFLSNKGTLSRLSITWTCYVRSWMYANRSALRA
jgi:hypothetical protein